MIETDIRRKRFADGRRAEWKAVLWLRLHGYRILARRCKTPVGEIDIVALRRGRLAFVEVKSRPTRDAAEAALTTHQTRRLHRAADYYVTRHPRLAALDQHFDALLIVPGKWPEHICDGLSPVGTSGRRY